MAGFVSFLLLAAVIVLVTVRPGGWGEVTVALPAALIVVVARLAPWSAVRHELRFLAPTVLRRGGDRHTPRSCRGRRRALALAPPLRPGLTAEPARPRQLIELGDIPRHPTRSVRSDPSEPAGTPVLT
ncbi:MAG TPA: hypothetical protein VIK61_03295 [Acidimicrobiia bacterium]